MKLIVVDNYEELSQLTAAALLGYMLNTQGRINVAVTGGNSPIRAYEILSDKIRGKDYLNNVHYYNFDELPYRTKDAEGITVSDLRRIFYEPAQIPESQIHKLDENNYTEFDAQIAKDGGLDLILMGIGADGHFCGNLPGTTEFKDFTSRVNTTPELKEMMKAHYDDPADVPDYYVTMGPASVMAAKNLLLIASGKGKADIINKFVHNNVSAEYPATLLKMHPNLTVIVDKDAAALLPGTN